MSADLHTTTPTAAAEWERNHAAPAEPVWGPADREPAAPYTGALPPSDDPWPPLTGPAPW